MQKFREYSHEQEDLMNQRPKFFHSLAASNALGRGDIEFAIFAAGRGLDAQGSVVDQHFIYNTLIQAYQRLGDVMTTTKYCLAELTEIPNLSGILKQEFNT
jgi:hypothetical protein